MKTAKKKKLESKGWKVGSVGEFLGLSKKELKVVEEKLVLTSLKAKK